MPARLLPFGGAGPVLCPRKHGHKCRLAHGGQAPYELPTGQSMSVTPDSAEPGTQKPGTSSRDPTLPGWFPTAQTLVLTGVRA